MEIIHRVVIPERFYDIRIIVLVVNRVELRTTSSKLVHAELLKV